MIKKILTIIFLILLLILFFVSEFNKQPQQSWEMNFSGISKDPYGCYVLRKTIDEHKILDFHKTTNATLYNTLPSLYKESGTSFIIITDYLELDSLNLNAAYNYVSRGNNLFVSSYTFPKRLKDSLKFEDKVFGRFSINNTEKLNFTNPNLKLTKNAVFEEMNMESYAKIDTLNHLVLGTNSSGKANYIKVSYGKGYFYIHCQPLVFTNYHVLYSNPDYAYRALSYLNKTTLVWDDYYKPQAGKYTPENQTPFRYILSQYPLRVALYLTLILIAIYFLIESKRKLRPIPIVEPLKNSTVSFVSTIARLYQGQPDYKKMASKKFLYLKEMVYSRYLIRLDENNPDTASQLSEKTSFPTMKMQDIFNTFQKISVANSVDAQTLISFSKQVDEFYEFEKEK